MAVFKNSTGRSRAMQEPLAASLLLVAMSHCHLLQVGSLWAYSDEHEHEFEHESVPI